MKYELHSRYLEAAAIFAEFQYALTYEPLKFPKEYAEKAFDEFIEAKEYLEAYKKEHDDEQSTNGRG